jgi:XTP/dITP diphosphohydrolase
MSKPLLVVGTANRKKGRELAELFWAVGVELKTLADFPAAIPVIESAATFAENAALKATEQARNLGQWVLADDSGLEVDALAGAPGVASARFSGPGASDAANNRLLLEKLGSAPLEKRTARFVCHMVLADASGKIRAESEGACRGRILFEPRGGQGFGYDPLFEVLEYHRTFAELGIAVKSCISHRARAARLLVPSLIALVDSGQFSLRSA